MSAKQHVVEINPAKDTPVTRHHTTNTPVVEFDGAMPSFKHVPKMKLVKGNLVVINHATSTPVTEFDGATSTFKHVAKKKLAKGNLVAKGRHYVTMDHVVNFSSRRKLHRS